MGEAQRKKLVGNTEPSNPKWRKTKKITQKEIQALSRKIMIEMGWGGLERSYWGG